jgi:hypothetical protein
MSFLNKPQIFKRFSGVLDSLLSFITKLLLEKRFNLSLYLTPFAVFVLSVFIWPNGGLGNNGHCDAWYYWGMAHSTDIVSNTFAWDYYPSSRVPMYALGWLIPITLNAVLWSKLYMILSSIVPILFVLPFIQSSKRHLALAAYFLGFLIPISFSQTSATYSGISFGWLCATILYIYGNHSSLKSGRVFGFLCAMLLFANAENIFFLVILFLAFLIQQGNVRVSVFFNILFGLLLCYLTLVTVLVLGGLALRESLQFPIPQFNAALYASQNSSFFLDNNSAWLISTPLLLCHFGIILISFLFYKLFSVNGFKHLAFFASAQLALLLIFQLLGFSIIFNNGFDALSAYWICVLMMFLCLSLLSTRNGSYILIVSVIFFLFITFSQYTVWMIRKYAENYERLIISVVIPLFAITLVIFLIKSFKFSARLLPCLPLFLVPFLGIQTSDYSSSFYQTGNRIFSETYFWTSSEYRSADWAITAFSKFLRPPTAITFLESPAETEQTMIIRASIRSFATCSGNVWSNFEKFDLGVNDISGVLPKRILLASSKILSEKEIHEKLPEYQFRHPLVYSISGKHIYWYQLVLKRVNSI